MRARAALALVAALLALAAPAAAAAGPPQVEAAWAEDVTATSALLKAKINPDGASTHYRFEYLSEAAWEAHGESFAGASTVPPLEGSLGSGTSAVTAFANLGFLAPATAYRYRPVAHSSEGSTIGAEHVLTTEDPTNAHSPIDGRGFELVSPVDKGGGAIAAPESLFGGGAFQAASAGGALTYSSASSFGDSAGAPPASQYLSTRGEGGWSTTSITVPTLAGAYGDEPDGAPYRLFSTDLARGLMLNGSRCQAAPCPRGYSLRDLPGGAVSPTPEALDLALEGATPDLRHAVFSSCAALTADATDGCPGERNLYEWSGGEPALVNLLPGESTGAPGAQLAAPLGAISADGARVYFDLAGDLYLREGGATHPVDKSGAAGFQAASADGSLAFFTKASHLYRYPAGGSATDIALTGGIQGVLGVSASGDTAYYQDAAGLQQWRAGAGIAQIAAGPEIAAPSDYLPSAGAPTPIGTARVSADGRHLAFLSKAQIPPFDNTDAETGEPDSELYLYGPPPGGGPAQLICASCNPSGERPKGSASIPGAVADGSTRIYEPRALSATGNRLFFDSADRLVSADADSRPDVYEWEAQGEGDCVRAPGCVGLISGGGGEGGSFLDASADGADAFFLTGESLVGADPGSIDAYDYRVGGGFHEPERPIACIGDACQALPSPPEDPTPGTLTKNSGNPPVRYFKPNKHEPKPKHHRKKRHRRHHGGRR